MINGNAPATTTPRRRSRHRREDAKSWLERNRAQPDSPSHLGIIGLAAKALAYGGSQLGTCVAWNVSGYCERPMDVSRVGVRREAPDKPAAALRVLMQVPCRRCSACLRRRAAIYRRQAETELEGAPSTLFGTLTYSQGLHLRILTQARRHAQDDGIDFDSLSLERQFELRCVYARPFVTRFMKIIRRRLPSPILGDRPLANFRYLLVAEPHGEASGKPEDCRPHWHLLLHTIHEGFEPKPTMVVKHRDDGSPFEVPQYLWLEEKWSQVCGEQTVSRWRLADAGSARYLTAYLAKDSRSKVSPSENYGGFVYDFRKNLTL